MASSNSTHATTGTTLWDEFQSIAEEWENDGWLHKFFDDQGRERWALTTLGTATAGLCSLDDRGAKGASQ
jgi:hypothetical protein